MSRLASNRNIHKNDKSRGVHLIEILHKNKAISGKPNVLAELKIVSIFAAALSQDS